ncbi:glutamyl-tRNA reductase [Leucobacter sp. HY1910]
MNFSLVHTNLSGPVEPMQSGLSCLSLDHKKATLALLERVERYTPELTSALERTAGGAVVLATCNRFEAYFDAPPGTTSLVLRTISEITGIPEPELAQAAQIRHGSDAAGHLFSVSSGLESLVVGEGEISGQVRRAFTAARHAGATTADLERLFQQAARVSRKVKARTRVQTRGRSLVRLALLLAESRIGDWGTTRVLLVGTGAYAAVTLAALHDRGATNVAVHSPSGRAEAFAATRNVRPVSGAHLDAELAIADVVIACSAAQDPLLDAEIISRTVTAAASPFCGRFTGRPAVASRPKPRLLIDLGVPRNIAPPAAQVAGIELLDLEVIAAHASVEELSAEAEARQITLDAAREFAETGAELAAVPAVLYLRDYVHGVLEAELERATRARRARTASQADAEPTAAAVQAALKHFAGRLLHEPTVRIRALGRAGHASEAVAAAHTLFGPVVSMPGTGSDGGRPAAPLSASPPLRASTP